nr:MAG TPA: TerY-C metal binding domain [Caudoviricetes sp.]
MAYYNTCPWCGASLDPGESCDCKRKKSEAAATGNGLNKNIQLQYITTDRKGQVLK